MKSLYKYYLEKRFNVKINLANTGKWMTFYKGKNGNKTGIQSHTLSELSYILKHCATRN